MREGRSGRQRRAAWALALTAMAGLTACNTIEGAGRDIEALGRTLADSADRARP